MKLLIAQVSCILLVAFAGRGYCQDSSAVRDSGGVWKISFEAETGYTTFSLNDAHSAFQSLLDAYRQIDIPLPTQTMFPGNMLIGGSVLFSSDLPVELGFGAYFSKSAAISSYKDFSGTMLERMDMDMTTVHFTVRIGDPAGSPGYFIYAQPGLTFAVLDYSENVDLTYPAPQSVGHRTSEHGFEVDGEAGVGVAARVYRLPISVEVGYREAKITTLTSAANNFSIPLDVSGLVIKAAIGVDL